MELLRKIFYFKANNLKFYQLNNSSSILLNKKTAKEHNKYEKIPAAKRLPIFGTTLDLIAAGSAPYLHKFIDGRHNQFGKIFREKLGSTEIIFTSSPNLMRSIFSYEGSCPEHPLPEAWLLYNRKFNCKRGLLFMEGEEWLKNRKIMNTLILNGDLFWMNRFIESSTNDFLKNLLICSNNTSDYHIIENLESKLYEWSIQTLIEIMLGKSLEDTSFDLRSQIHLFTEKIHKIFFDSVQLMNFPVTLAERLNLKRWRNFETSVTDGLQIGNNIVDLALKEKNLSAVSLLMRMQNEKLSTVDIKRIFVDLIMAAGDTTAFSSQWILYMLSTHTNVQENIRNLVIGKNFDWFNLNSYLKSVIRETLRLYPVAPFIGRNMPKEIILNNKYKIDKGTLIISSLYTSGRDENNFPNAHIFDPDRWERSANGQLKNVKQVQGSLPFAMGVRSCIGKKIALLQMQCLISKILENGELKCFNETPVEIILRLVAVPNQKLKIGFRKI